MFQMMENDRNSSQYEQAGSYVTDTGGEEEVLLTPITLTTFDCRPLEGESSQFTVDPDASLLHSGLEEDQRNALRPFGSIENAIRSTNWESRSQFRLDLNGNSHTSSEFWKTFLEIGDEDYVETTPCPENVGTCSRATQGPLLKRNHTVPAARTARNLKPRRNQKKIDGGRRHRGPNWTLEENRSFLQHMEVQKGKSPWKAISDSLKAMGFVREAKPCEDHWGVLLADLTKFEKYFGSDDILRDRHFWPSVGTMSRDQRAQNKLPLVFEEDWFEAVARIVKERSIHRKSRREYSKDRIDVATATRTLSSSSCRQQSRRVSAASATPSSDIFDNLVGDGDGISGLVKLLVSADRSVTVDQTIEVLRISLEAQKMDLRRQEIEWEKERTYMNQGQRNGL